MVYLFCNTGYGSFFLKEFTRYALLNDIETCIVYSIKYKKKPPKSKIHFMLYYINKIKWKLKHQSLNNSYFKINRIKTLYIEDINSNSFLKKIKPDDYGIITGFNQIFKKNAINHFKALVNFHPSLLPLYRGPIPSYWCIKNVEKFTGFSLHEVSETIDCGTIIYQDIVEINSIKDPSKLDLKIARSASKVLLMYLDHLCKGTPLNPRTINAFNYYHNRVEYYSFQRQSKQ